jgi:hypothetical protein
LKKLHADYVVLDNQRCLAPAADDESASHEELSAGSIGMTFCRAQVRDE